MTQSPETPEVKTTHVSTKLLSDGRTPIAVVGAGPAGLCAAIVIVSGADNDAAPQARVVQ
jgi:ribulose 1,5-bisphosphate synthetase/thiazole synthase